MPSTPLPTMPARFDFRVQTRQITHWARALPSHNVRMNWFRAKRLCGLPTRSDRSFLVRELVRLLDNGQIGRTCHVTASGRTDGAGAQALSAMSAMALARHYGLTYVHSPFRSIAHAEQAPADWTARWEKAFNLGLGEKRADFCDLPRVGIEEFVSDRTWWSRPCLLHAGHFVRFTDQRPEALQAIVPTLRARFQRHRKPDRRVLSVAAHLRRGDVSAHDPETAHRAASLESLVASIEQVRSIARELAVPLQVKVYSQGPCEPLSALTSLGCELHLETPALEAFHDMVAADLLIMGRSTRLTWDTGWPRTPKTTGTAWNSRVTRAAADAPLAAQRA